MQRCKLLFGGFLPPYRFNCLWACSFHCQFPRFEIGVRAELRRDARASRMATDGDGPAARRTTRGSRVADGDRWRRAGGPPYDARRAHSAPARTLALCREGLGGGYYSVAPLGGLNTPADAETSSKIALSILFCMVFSLPTFAADTLRMHYSLHISCTLTALFLPLPQRLPFSYSPHILPYFTPVCQSRCPSGQGDGICFHDAHCGISD